MDAAFVVLGHVGQFHLVELVGNVGEGGWGEGVGLEEVVEGVLAAEQL